MRLTIILFIISTLGAGNLMAQTADDIPDKYSDAEVAWAKERTQMIDKQLDLTADQKREIMLINLKSADRYDRMVAKGKTDAELDAYRDKMFEKRVRSYNSVLTPAQREKFQAQVKDVREREANQDKVERNERVRAKAKEEGYTRDDVMDKKENRDDKNNDGKKDEVKTKAKDSDATKKDVKEKKKKKNNN